MGIALRPKGDLVASVINTHQLAVFTPNGAFQRTICEFGSGQGKFNWPEGIAGSGSRVFVADTWNERVQVLDAADGAFLFEKATDRFG